MCDEAATDAGAESAAAATNTAVAPSAGGGEGGECAVSNAVTEGSLGAVVKRLDEGVFPCVKPEDYTDEAQKDVGEYFLAYQRQSDYVELKSCRSHKCDICGKELNVDQYSSSQLCHRTDAGQNKHLRCQQCHFCSGCGQSERAEHFDGRAKRCRTCTDKARPHKCDACNCEKPEETFNQDNIENASRGIGKLVCHPCRANGYCPRDIRPYQCNICGPRGVEKFRDRKDPCCIDCCNTHERRNEYKSASVYGHIAADLSVCLSGCRRKSGLPKRPSILNPFGFVV